MQNLTASNIASSSLTSIPVVSTTTLDAQRRPSDKQTSLPDRLRKSLQDDIYGALRDEASRFETGWGQCPQAETKLHGGWLKSAAKIAEGPENVEVCLSDVRHTPGKYELRFQISIHCKLCGGATLCSNRHGVRLGASSVLARATVTVTLDVRIWIQAGDPQKISCAVDGIKSHVSQARTESFGRCESASKTLLTESFAAATRSWCNTAQQHALEKTRPMLVAAVGNGSELGNYFVDLLENKGTKFDL